MCSLPSRVRQPLESLGSVANGGKGRLDGIRRSDALPVLGRKVVKGQQFFSVFLQADSGFRILRLIGFNEQLECLLGVCLCLGLPDRVQCLFRFRPTWVGSSTRSYGRVHPAALLACLGIDFFQCRPEPHRPVTDGQLRDIHPPRLQLQQDLAPTLCRFPHTVFNRQKTLLSAFIHADHDQRTQLGLFGPQSTVDAVGPDIDPAVGVQTLVAPDAVLLGRAGLLHQLH